MFEDWNSRTASESDLCYECGEIIGSAILMDGPCPSEFCTFLRQLDLMDAHELNAERGRLTDELMEGSNSSEERQALYKRRRSEINNVVAAKLIRVEEALHSRELIL